MAGDKDRARRRWAGHGHLGGFLLQTLVLILVKLGIWAFIFLVALRLSGEPMPWDPRF